MHRVDEHYPDYKSTLISLLPREIRLELWTYLDFTQYEINLIKREREYDLYMNGYEDSKYTKSKKIKIIITCLETNRFDNNSPICNQYAVDKFLKWNIGDSLYLGGPRHNDHHEYSFRAISHAMIRVKADYSNIIGYIKLCRGLIYVLNNIIFT